MSMSKFELQQRMKRVSSILTSGETVSVLISHEEAVERAFLALRELHQVVSELVEREAG